jgi:hypothetical protein
MALRHINLTIGAAATPVTTSDHKGVRQMIIQNTAQNSAIYIGDSDVSATDYGHTLAAEGIVTIGPFSGDAPLNTKEVYIAGTENDVVHILLITH